MANGDLERFRKLEEIFHAVLAAPAGPERDAVIRERCASDQSLTLDLAGLLANDAEVQAARPAARPPSMPRFGAWQAVRILGRGGLGTVYLAERADGAFHRTAAVKVVPLALTSPDVEQRFLRERKLLARFDHPGIAHLLDGGVSENGLPYLVMEYVDGTRLDVFCDNRRMDIPGRLRLFLEICTAVEYAHRNLVVHLDLKPSNILVTEAGTVKLLDFGTSKLMEPDGLLTSTLMFTPFYASPEQLRNEPVTTACDIYSLGVILFELLCGRRPHEYGTLSEVIEHVRSGRFPAPLESAVSAKAAENRGISEIRLRGMLEGDLATVTAKCIAPEPAERYVAVTALSDDLNRYLAGHPVLARPQTFVYRSMRFISRNRWRVGMAALLLAILVFAGAFALAQRAREERRAAQVRSMSQANLSEVYRAVSSLPGSTRARLLIVEQARNSLDQLLAESPADPDVRRAAALAYAQLAAIQGAPFSVSMADTAGALASYRRAEQLAAMQPAGDWGARAILVDARLGIAQLQIRSKEYEAASRTVQTAIESARLLWQHGPGHLSPAVLQLIGNSTGKPYVQATLLLGHILLDESDAYVDPNHVLDALHQLEKAMAVSRAVAATDPGAPDLTGHISQFIAYALQGYGERVGDMAYYRRAVAAHQVAVDWARKIYESAPNPESQRNYADTLAASSWALRLAGEKQEAVVVAKQALALMAQVADADPGSTELHFDLAYTYLHLGAAEGSAGESAAALRDLRKAASMVVLPEEVHASDHHLVDAYLKIRDQLAGVLLETGNRSAAIQVLREGVAAARHPDAIAPRRLAEIEAKLAAAEKE